MVYRIILKNAIVIINDYVYKFYLKLILNVFVLDGKFKTSWERIGSSQSFRVGLIVEFNQD